MPKHDLPYALENVKFPLSMSGMNSENGRVFGYGETVGNGLEGWAPGAIFLDTDASSASQLYVNEGTSASASWVVVKQTAGTDVTVASGSTLTMSAGSTAQLEDSVPLNFGTGTDHVLSSDGTNLSLTTTKGYNFDEGLPNRLSLLWVAGERGKPGLNADIQNAAEATRMVTDPYFEVLGTNASSDDVTYNAEGGITFTTDGADGDGVILLPHLDANQSPWTQFTWGTDRQVKWECDISTGANIGNSIVWCGLKLTNTATTATDDDQVFFRYENGVNSGKWQAIYSIGGTDTATDTGVTGAIATRIHFAIRIDTSRVATMYMDGTLVATSTALTNTTDLIPYIGVEADGAAEAKTLTIRSQRISRAYA